MRRVPIRPAVALTIWLAALAGSVQAGAAQANPGILVSGDWLVEHRDDPEVVVLHVGMGRMAPLEEYVQGRTSSSITTSPSSGTISSPNSRRTRTSSRPSAPRASPTTATWSWSGIPASTRPASFMTLDYLGHGDRTSVLDGGLAAWKAAGGEVAAEPAPPPRGDFEADVREDMIVTAEWIRDRLDDPDVTLIDARPEDEYTGERPGRDFLRGGHIPGAYNLYWQDLTGDDIPTLIDLAEVEARYEEAGAKQDGVVVSYCLIGMRASYTYMISRYLGYETKFYDASWNDWGRREDLPLVTGLERR